MTTIPSEPAGTTRRWTGEAPRALPSGEVADPGAALFEPVLDRVSARHARVYGARRLEPEVMDEAGAAEAYMSAAGEAHLARLDASWIERVVAFGPRGGARVLDVGAGGGQIPARIARRRPDWRIWAVDRSGSMLTAGAAGITGARHRAVFALEPFRVGLALAEARALPFPDGAFDLVISNSLLHHIGDPTPVLDEIARVAHPSGRVLLRDLRRPPRGLMRAWVAWHGRHYGGEMRRLYEDSVAAAFTPAELAIVIRHSRLVGAAVAVAGPYLVVTREEANRRGLQLAARPGSPRKPTPPPEERP
ncbi:MAG TPA: class I SAM-dependent methyltransferase [Gemmatimonadota bacterium]|nr:class I SAM-dependent methyltransferase [Gemmatimonadota bacterium]